MEQIEGTMIVVVVWGRGLVRYSVNIERHIKKQGGISYHRERTGSGAKVCRGDIEAIRY